MRQIVDDDDDDDDDGVNVLIIHCLLIEVVHKKKSFCMITRLLVNQ